LGHVSALTGLTAWLDISAWTTVSRQQSGAFGRYDTMGVANHLAILLEIESPGACINRFLERRISARERQPDRQQTAPRLLARRPKLAAGPPR